MGSDNIAISVKGLGKKYSLGGSQEKYLTFRDAIVNSVKAPFRRFSSPEPPQDFWALKDVSFDVEHGEVVGIIGRNGAGKSTLLKILSRITTPTEGSVDLYGRVGSLLEVGTGFHPELTGRENIYMSGSILGMKHREIDAKLDEIVKFSEIEKFLDTPVKHYSSGMYVRLAFAVAAHMDTEILLVDEVLAVGDAQFQKKCMGKMGDVAAKEGRTVLFVSHNMAAITNLCEKVMRLEKGQLTEFDAADVVVGHYLMGDEEGATGMKVWGAIQNAPGDNFVRLHAVKVTQNDVDFLSQVDISQNIDINIYYWNLVDQSKYYFSICLRDNQGNNIFNSVNLKSFTKNTDTLCGTPLHPGLYKSTCRIPADLLNSGFFSVSVTIVRYPAFGEYPHHIHIYEDAVLSFEGIDMGNMLEDHCFSATWPGYIRPRLSWSSEYQNPLLDD